MKGLSKELKAILDEAWDKYSSENDLNPKKSTAAYKSFAKEFFELENPKENHPHYTRQMSIEESETESFENEKVEPSPTEPQSEQESEDTVEESETSGIGSVVNKVTKATGIKAVVRMLNGGEDCEACNERRQEWDLKWPLRKPKPLTESEFEYLDKFYSQGKRAFVNKDEQLELLSIFNRIYNSKKKFTTCIPCVRALVENLNTVYTKTLDL